MPMQLKRPCNHPGCAALTDNRYCDKHKAKQVEQVRQQHKSYDLHRKDRDAVLFYRNPDWTLTSLQYRAVHPVCEHCNTKPSKLVHHEPELQVLIDTGRDPLDWQWLQALCWGCHERTKRK